MCDRLSITSLICFLSIRNLNLPLNERMNRIYHVCIQMELMKLYIEVKNGSPLLAFFPNSVL